MDRKEFSKLISKTREELNISKYRVAKDSGLSEQQIGRIDNALNAYSIDNMFRYLNAMKVSIKLYSESYNAYFLLNKRADFITAFKSIRALNKLSQSKAASTIGIDRAIITGIESRDVDTSIDKFLQCIYGLGYEIEIIKIENNY